MNSCKPQSFSSSKDKHNFAITILATFVLEGYCFARKLTKKKYYIMEFSPQRSCLSHILSLL